MKKLNIMTALLCLVAIGAFIAGPALAAPRDTQETSGALIQARAGETIEVGHLIVARGTSYLAWNATDGNTNAIIALGRAETGASSNELFYVKPGIYKWNQTGTIAVTDVGQSVYAMNSTTVTTAAVATNDLAVGKLVRVETDGVWVKTDL